MFRLWIITVLMLITISCGGGGSPATPPGGDNPPPSPSPLPTTVPLRGTLTLDGPSGFIGLYTSAQVRREEPGIYLLCYAGVESASNSGSIPICSDGTFTGVVNRSQIRNLDLSDVVLFFQCYPKYLTAAGESVRPSLSHTADDCPELWIMVPCEVVGTEVVLDFTLSPMEDICGLVLNLEAQGINYDASIFGSTGLEIEFPELGYQVVRDDNYILRNDVTKQFFAAGVVTEIDSENETFVLDGIVTISKFGFTIDELTSATIKTHNNPSQSAWHSTRYFWQDNYELGRFQEFSIGQHIVAGGSGYPVGPPSPTSFREGLVAMYVD